MRKIVSLFLALLFASLITVPQVTAQTTLTACDADITEDGTVNISDYSLLVTDFFSNNPSNSRTDINQDGSVNLTDYSLLASFFFADCEPEATPTPTPSPTPTPVASPSPTPSPSPSSEIPEGAIIIEPSTSNTPTDYAKNLVNANPAGSTYYFQPGVHRINTINPKNGDTFIGATGAVLSGSNLATNPQQQGGLWYIDGQTQEMSPHGECNPSSPRCNRAEELFIDDVRQKHVASLDEVGLGEFYFDYPADRIYFGTNPAGKKIEASSSRFAFMSSASSVTIRNFIVEKFASRAQRGAIDALEDDAQNWTIEFNEVRLNHASGIRSNDGSIVRNNYVHSNGQLGLNGGGSNAIIEKNEVVGNNEAGFNAGWEAGASKFSVTTDLLVQDNYVHHNFGPGLWTDVDNVRAIFQRNVSVYNDKEGIDDELGFDTTFRDNFVAYNGKDKYNWFWGGQIGIQNSSGATVHGNTVIVDANFGNGISIVSQNRGTSLNFPDRYWASQSISVYDNDIYALGARGALTGVVSDASEAPFDMASILPTISIDNNNYYVADTGYRYFLWNNSFYYFDNFSTVGNEVNGTVSSDLSNVPAIPNWNYPRGQQ